MQTNFCLGAYTAELTCFLARGCMSTDLLIETIEPSAASTAIEFRCTRCWNSNVANCSASGSAFECVSCGHSLTVPEATPERIARAKSLLNEPQPSAKPQLREQLNEVLSDRELIRLANEELRIPLDQQNFADHRAASLWTRFFAHLIDSFLLFGAVALAVVIVMVFTDKNMDRVHPTSARNLIPGLLLISIPAILTLVQWSLISCEGQTIGKKLLMLRIVTVRGRLPGFVQGVLLRNWLRVVLSLCIPFFGVLDPIFALGESRRSLHDLISGTRVVEIN